MRTASKVLQFPVATPPEDNGLALFERGVWHSPYLVRGMPALIAVDSHGLRIAEVVVENETRVDDLCEALYDLLHKVDPTQPADR